MTKRRPAPISTLSGEVGAGRAAPRTTVETREPRPCTTRPAISRASSTFSRTESIT
jgi:hypothetical protein